MVKDTLNRTAVRTALCTLFIAVVTFGYGSAILGLASPGGMAIFCDVIGAKSAAAMYYERIYERDGTTENLYLVLDRYISVRNNKKIIEHGAEFFSDSRMGEREEIIKDVDSEGKKAAIDAGEYVLMGNEDNRLRYMYIDALLKVGKTETARDVFCDEIDARMPVATTNELARPLHAYFAFVAAGKQSLVRDKFIEYLKEFYRQYQNDSITFGATDPVKLVPLNFLIIFGSYFKSLLLPGELLEDVTGMTDILLQGLIIEYNFVAENFVPFVLEGFEG